MGGGGSVMRPMLFETPSVWFNQLSALHCTAVGICKLGIASYSQLGTHLTGARENSWGQLHLGKNNKWPCWDTEPHT